MKSKDCSGGGGGIVELKVVNEVGATFSRLRSLFSRVKAHAKSPRESGLLQRAECLRRTEMNRSRCNRAVRSLRWRVFSEMEGC